jgi:conjugative relaxase-like TrwC/TraI family protein
MSRGKTKILLNNTQFPWTATDNAVRGLYPCCSKPTLIQIDHCSHRGKGGGIYPMFTCAKIRNGGSYLGNHLTANDYYCENENVYGKWVGLAAERLGLSGQSIGAGDAAFEALRQNRLPYGKGKLTPLRKDDGVRFFDFQCSAQKSVSIMAVVMKDRRLLEAHDRASEKAFAELERFAAFRHGKSREPAISGNLCAAAFRHDASRALDPQLHTHFVVANATWDGKRWLALDTYEMFKATRYAGKVYQNELAIECRRLGYSIETIRNDKGVIEGFEIAGVSKEIRERYSKRRAEVEAGIERFR